jgi:hypothetical protein
MTAPARFCPLRHAALRVLLVWAIVWACVLPVSTGAWAQTPVAPAASGAVDADARSAGVAQAVLGILSYVRWPQEAAEVSLCIVGPTEYADELTRAQAFSLPGGRRIQVRRHAAAEVPATACDVVYLGMLDDAGWQTVFRRLAGRPVLSIGERREQCHAGGMFCLDVRERELGFEVNLDSVARSGLRIHPQVLQLARRKAKAP